MKRFSALTLMLSLAMFAGGPEAPSFRILPLDTKTGAALQDLKPEELRVKLGGEARKVTRVEPPKADVPVRWVLLFEPIRETSYRALAFLAAAEFLRQLPEGDEVLLVVREKEVFRPLGSRFSLNKEALAQQFLTLPDRVPEFLNTPCKGELLPIDGGPAEAAGDVAKGNKTFEAIVQRISSNAQKFAKGLNDPRGTKGMDPTLLGPAAEILRVEMTKSLPALVDQLAALPGDKHLVIFSRNESDELTRPDFLNSNWTAHQVAPDPRLLGQSRNPAKYVATPDDNLVAAAREALTSRETFKARVSRHDLMIHSVAGAGQNIVGFMGDVAPITGGQVFTFTNGLERTLPGALFGYRDCLQVTLEGSAASKPAKLEIEVTRSNVKLIYPKQR